MISSTQFFSAQRAGARVLANGEGLVDATIVIGVSGKFLKEHPDVVRKYLALHQDNLRFLKEQQAKAYEFTAKETGLSVDDVKLMAPWYDFSTDKDIKDLEETQEFLLANGMQKNKIDIKSMLAEVK